VGAREGLRSGRTDPRSKRRPAPGRKRRRWLRLDNRPSQVTRSQVVDEYHGLIAWTDLIARPRNSISVLRVPRDGPVAIDRGGRHARPFQVQQGNRDLIIVSRRGQEHGRGSWPARLLETRKPLSQIPPNAGKGLNHPRRALPKPPPPRVESLLEGSPCSGRNRHCLGGVHKAVHPPGHCGYAVPESAEETVLPFPTKFRLRFADWNRRGQGVEGVSQMED